MTTKNKTLNSDKFEFIENKNNKVSNDSHLDYLNLENVENKNVLSVKQSIKSEEIKSKLEAGKNQKLNSSRSSSRIIPTSKIKSVASAREKSKNPEKRKVSKTKEKSSDKNLSRNQSPFKTVNSISKKNDDNCVEKKTDLCDEQNPKEKILDIRSHLNKFYEAKTQNQKNNLLKQYMTNPSKGITENYIKYNATTLTDSKEKNKIMNSLLNTGENNSSYNIHNKTQNYSINQTKKIQNNDRTNMSIEMNRRDNKKYPNESEDITKLSIESPKKYREDACLYNTRQNNIHNELNNKKDIFILNMKKNTDIDDSIGNFELTKESSLNRYNFKTDFVVPRINSLNNYSNINKAPRRDTENNINYIHSNQTNSRISLENPIVPRTDNINYLNIKQESADNERKDPKTLDKNFIYYQGREKRLQELNLMNSYIDSLSQISLNPGPSTPNDDKSRKNLNQDQNKTNIVFIPSQINNDQEMRNEGDSKIINKTSLYNSNNILNENSKHNKICMDSQIEQESIRHEITKKLKNQVYEKEYARVNHQIDYVNERLKLNELSKSYLMTKINEYSIKANEESVNIGEYENDMGIIII